MRILFDEYAEAIFTAFISIIVFSVFISSLLSDLIGMNMDFVDESLKPISLNKYVQHFYPYLIMEDFLQIHIHIFQYDTRYNYRHQPRLIG